MNARHAIRRRARPPEAAGGFTLIELLVSMALGLIVTSVVASLLITGERDRRGTTAVNDINQSGSYAAYLLDRQIRSAGSGYTAAWTSTVGCQLYAQNAAGQVLPRIPAFSASSPFARWSANGLPLRLAPIVVGKGMADTGTEVRGDVIAVMAGAGGYGESPAPVLSGVSYSGARMLNTIGWRTGDMILLVDPGVAGCMVQQVQFSGANSGGGSQALPFGGTYNVGVIAGLDVSSFGGNTTGVHLGNINSNVPQFALLGVGANGVLYSNDLLAPIAPDDIGVPIADGVIEMRALYGVSGYPTAATPDVVAWADPGTAGYTAAELTSGSATSLTTLHTIVAVRLGMVLRTSIGDQAPMYSTDPSHPTILTMFADTKDKNGASLAQTRAVPTGAPYYRYRTIEVTVPLRNVMLAP